jgi:hypothetical protein
MIEIKFYILDLVYVDDDNILDGRLLTINNNTKVY